MYNVQFRGLDAVLEAYDSRAVEFWGIWQKKSLIHKGQGMDELKPFLELLAQNDNNAIYTLKVFEDAKQLKDIKEKTEADGSYNFILGSGIEGGGYAAGDASLMRYQAINTKNKLFERLDAIEGKLAGIGSTEEPEEEEETLQDKIIGIISDPDKLRSYTDIFKDLFGFNNNQQQQPQQLRATLGNVKPQPMPQQPTEQDMKRLADALDILGQHDEKIIEHLEKLAMLAQDKPGKFKSLLGMLETFM